MRIIGITGGIGSGKSEIVNILRNLGAGIIDADQIAREIVKKDTLVLHEIVYFFGQDILDEQGELNRKKLGEIVFNDSIKLEKLNSITHRHIENIILERVNEFRALGIFEILVIEAAIPFKKGFLDVADEIWVVICDKEKRISRIMKRNNLTYDQALARIQSQRQDSEYIEIADRIIENEDNLKKLEENIQNIYFR